MPKRVVKKKCPCVVLNDLVILPGMVVHFDIKRPFSVKAIENAMHRDHKIFVVAAKSTDEKEEKARVYEYGTIALVKQVIKLSDNVLRVLVEGLDRGFIVDTEEEDTNYVYVKAAYPKDDWYIGEASEAVNPEYIEDAEKESNVVAARIALLRETVVSFLKFNPKMAVNLKKQFEKAKTLSEMLDCMAANLPLDYKQRQQVLEAVELSDRFDVMMVLLRNNIEVYEVKSELSKHIKERVEKNQKEYVLREQIKVIKEELGDEDSEKEENDYRDRVKKLKAKDEVKKVILKEIDRYSRIHSGSSESEVSRGYIETLLSLPWDKMSKDNKDLLHAEEVLEKDHYGLTKVKERVIEFLAVRNLTKKGESPIICLVGPPGTGKTSIAKSIATALNKEYIRICLGGVRDEAEIRGHRRTYVGAMPGRIATGIRKAGVKNPLMLLDEIDKMSSDHRGETASALLEVLDPEQNARFSDHYIEVPMDLSEVLFIATANSLSDIPKPLKDRMEIIEVCSYTENEKIHIAKEHLLAKQIEKHGLKDNQLIVADTVWHELISGYTREAGVRELERKIAAICRKAARQVYENKKTVRVNKVNLEEFLGKKKFREDSILDKDEVGIVRGLAWTSVGGDTLSIEVNSMPGRGELMLTGQLGDVMKESATAGVSYLRSIASKHGIKDDYFKKHDIHVHIPEGSVPKDGPSAGITMATAIYSVITNKKVRADVAMTGEITLRGRVLPIGGLKEKILAAKNAGIKKVIVPEKNEKDIEELDEEIKKGIKIVFVESMDEVLKEALA